MGDTSIIKPIIAVDIDDVIATNAKCFVEYSNERFGTTLTIDDYHEHWSTVWNVDHEETVRRAEEYHISGHIATYGIIEGAREALTELKKRFRLLVITSRRTSINQLTRDWIDTYYPDTFEDFIFAGFFDTIHDGSIHMTKADIAREIGAHYIIDDQLKHVHAAANIGIPGLLFGDYFWNRTEVLPDNVVRVRNWTEVLEYFADK